MSIAIPKPLIYPTVLNLLLVLIAGALTVPALALLLLTLAAGKRPAVQAAGTGPRPRVAVLVPAHNESSHVLPTIACLLPQMQAGDQLLVVADNCNDDTAELARRAGAEVIERQHLTERGKG